MITTKHTIERAENVLKNARELLMRPEGPEYECITLWSDLLGFSNHLNFSDDQKLNEEIGMQRIAAFHEISIQSMCENHEVIQLNDATVFCHTIKRDQHLVESLTEFFTRIDSFWEIANIADMKLGGFGVRGVVSTGVRYNLRGNFGWTADNDNFKSPNFISPSGIMMNIPFAKSYFVESSGELRKEPSLYVENRIFKELEFQIMETWRNHDVINNDQIGEYLLVRFNGESSSPGSHL